MTDRLQYVNARLKAREKRRKHLVYIHIYIFFSFPSFRIRMAFRFRVHLTRQQLAISRRVALTPVRWLETTVAASPRIVSTSIVDGIMLAKIDAPGEKVG